MTSTKYSTLFLFYQIFHPSHSHPSVGIRRSHHIVLLHLRSEDRNDLLRLAELSASLPSLVHATRLLLLAHHSLYRSFSLPLTPRLDPNHRQIALLRLRLRVQLALKYRVPELTLKTRLNNKPLKPTSRSYASSRLEDILHAEAVCDIDLVPKRLDQRSVQLEGLVPEKALNGDVQSLGSERRIE